MQKLYVLRPSASEDVKELQLLLDEGYEVKFSTASNVAIKSANYGESYTVYGKIYYILEKPDLIKNTEPVEKPESSEAVKTYEIILYQHSKDNSVFVFHKGDNNCENIKVGDKIIIDEKIFTIKEIQEFQKSFGIKGDKIAVVVE